MMSRRDFIEITAAVGLAACGSGNQAAAPGPAPAPEPPPAPAPPAKKSILILGGTGFLGPHLVEAAQAKGHTLTLFNRGQTNPHLFPDLEKLHGDRDGKLDALKGRTWDAVIDTSGYVPRVVKQSADLLATAVGQYVFISTISVFADPVKPGTDESGALATAPDPKTEEVREFYGALKALCEQTVEASLPGRTTVIRPGLIVGPLDPTDRFTYWPVRVARGGEVLAPGSGADPAQVIDVRDLAAWAIAMIEQGGVGVYNATGPAERLTIAALLDGCKSAAGGDAAFTWVPAKFLEEQKVTPWMDMPVWVPAEGDSEGFAQIDCRKAISKGLTFRPIGETAKATLDWWQTLPEERRAQPRAGLRAEREKEVLAAWHARQGK